MSKEWIILYVIIIGGVFYLSMTINALSHYIGKTPDQDENLHFIQTSLEHIEEIISKFYDNNSLREDMDPYEQYLREKNPPTIHDIIGELESINTNIDYIVNRLDEIDLSNNEHKGVDYKKPTQKGDI